MWSYVLEYFIYLCVAGVVLTILWLHASFWVNAEKPLLAFLTLPFCIIVALINVILIIRDSIQDSHFI